MGTWFEGLEDYPKGGVVRTFTKDGLVKIARTCGFSDISMYYPYPDYKFMTTLYSDERLPNQGELSANLRNFDRERLQLFDEKSVLQFLYDDTRRSAGSKICEIFQRQGGRIQNKNAAHLP